MDDSKIGKLDQAVRPVVILAFTGAVIYGFVIQLINSDAFLPIAMLAVGWLFGRQSSRPLTAPGPTSSTSTP